MITTENIVNAGKLRIIIDSYFFRNLSDQQKRETYSLISFVDNPLFEFVRVPIEEDVEILKSIPTYERTKNEAGIPDGIKYSDKWGFSAFPIPISQIESLGLRLFDKKTLTESMVRDLEIIFEVGALTERHIKSVSRLSTEPPAVETLFVTSRHRILQNRKKIEFEFYGKRINSMTLQEAKEIVGLFLKYRGHYRLAHNIIVSKSSYYSTSFNSRFPRLKLSNPTLYAFFRRMIFLLMTIDEMGFQFFSGANNATMTTSVYYFNYFITLVTGIFDSIANYLCDDLRLDVPQKSWISINPKAGEDLLEKVGLANKPLRELIQAYEPLVKLFYELREDVIHRNLLEEIGISTVGLGNAEWRLNCIKINLKVKQYIKECKEQNQKYSYFSSWGLYNLYKDRELYLEPYTFVKASSKKLIEFANEVFNLLPSSISTSPRDSQEERNIEIFKMTELGF